MHFIQLVRLGSCTSLVLFPGILAGGSAGVVLSLPIAVAQDGGFISTKSLCERYQYYDKQSQRFGPTLTKTIGGSIEKLCPSAEKDRKTEPSGQSRGYKVPSLEVARGEMAAYLKCTIDWGEDDVVELTDE